MDSGTKTGRMAERRSYGRVPLRVFVSVQCGVGADHTTDGFCRDVSQRGIYLFTESSLQQGSDVEVCIAQSPQASEAGELIVAYGHVKRSERYLDGRTGAAIEISRWVRVVHACDAWQKKA